MSKVVLKSRSFAENVRKRIESLENLVHEKLQHNDNLPDHESESSQLTGGRRVSNLNEQEAHDYFSWLKEHLHYANSRITASDSLVSNPKKRKYTEESQSTWEFSDLDYLPAFKSSIINNGIFSSLNSSKCFGPVTVGRYNLSFCLQLVVEVYCNKLDPDLFWLSREQVEGVLRSSDNTLLKYLIVDSALKVSSLTKEEKSHIPFLRQDLSSLIVSCYDEPNLISVVGLTFLALEEYLKYNITNAKLFLGKAFRLADTLKVNPDLREDLPNFLETCEVFTKDKLWEALLLIHGFIFIELPGPPLGKCSSMNSFPHVGSKEVSFPVISRVLEVPPSEKIPVHEVFKEFESSTKNGRDLSELMFNNVLVKHKRRTVSGLNLKIYMEVHQIYMKLYSFSLEVQHQYYGNPYDIPKHQLFLPNSQRNMYNTKLLHMIRNLPNYFSTPQVTTFHSIWNEFTPNISRDQDSSSLGNLLYIVLLSCLINVNYPFIWFDPQPLILPDKEAWEFALEGSDAIFNYFIAFSDLLQSTEHTDFIVFNLSDSLSAIYTYLNAILNCPTITHEYKGILLHRTQTIIDKLKLLSEQRHKIRHVNAKEVLRILKDSLVKFKMPEEFQFNI